MGFILALDQGTTSSRAVIYDDNQRIVSLAQQAFQQYFPKAGWVEHNAKEIWSSQYATALEALTSAGLTATDIEAIGITNQRETTVVWDRRNGEPIYNAIVWQDRRTAAHCDALREAGHEDELRQISGLLLDPYFSASKIQWILDHCDGAREAADAGHLAFGTIDSWLVWNLSNGRSHVTDVTNASRTNLLDLHSGEWHQDLLELWQIPASMLPTVTASSGALATATIDGLDKIPIAGIAGDQHAALFGQRCFSPGDAKCTYGTGCFLLLNCGATPIISNHRLLTSFAWDVNGRREYALEGSVFMGGATVQWLRDQLAFFGAADDIEALASSVPSSDGVTFVPAFAGLGAPYWDPHARGTLLGLTRGTGKAHIARAALEGIAYQVADVLHAMRADQAASINYLNVDGGASANDLLMQLQADILGAELFRPNDTECTALGAANLAGLAVGYWRDREELMNLPLSGISFSPTTDADQRRQQMGRWHEGVRRARNWASD